MYLDTTVFTVFSSKNKYYRIPKASVLLKVAESHRSFRTIKGQDVGMK